MNVLARLPRGPLIVAAVVVLLDQLTKHWALNALSDGHTIHLVWTLQLNLAFNTGMAFSKGDGLGPVIGVVALMVVVVMLVSLGRTKSRWNMVAIGLVIGGAIGNILDRLFRGEGWFRGAVVDFIDPQWFPVFNVADIGVTVGGCMLVLGYLIESRTGPSGGGAGGRADAHRGVRESAE
jgi:signal peptidase II